MQSKEFSNVNIDVVKEYWDRRPCNIRHSSCPVGTKEYFDEVERRKYFVEPHIPLFAQFEKWNGKDILEVGCGIGTDTINFARAGARVTAVDVSSESLAIARRRAEVFDLNDKIRFVRGDAEDLQELLPGMSFDLVYSFGVIHHTPNPENVLRGAYSLAKTGADLRIMVYNRWSWKVLVILFQYGRLRLWDAKRVVARHSEAQTGCPITYTYTPSEARKLVEGCGFSVTNIQRDHIFPYRVADYIEHRYVKPWYFRYMHQAAFRGLQKIMGWHLCVSAVKE